jgi:hypothetical protein
MENVHEDLFENYEQLPENVQELILEYTHETLDYNQFEDFIELLAPLGYTCSYGLDAVPYDLKQI